MIILTVIMVGYAVAAQSIAYPNGFYTSEELSLSRFFATYLLLSLRLSPLFPRKRYPFRTLCNYPLIVSELINIRNSFQDGTVQGMSFIDTIFSMYTTVYFQMFGDFSLDALQGEGE